MDIGFDFFLFIAFFIPGVFILYSITMVSAQLRNFLVQETEGKENHRWLLAASLCILLGMMSSIFRNMLIDWTFRKDWSVCSILPDTVTWMATDRIEPDYSRLSSDELEVLQELKNEEKRPYQFYGNTIIAIFCFILCYLATSIRLNNNRQWKQFCGWTVVLLFFCWILYNGSRFSHHNYMAAVKKLNEHTKQN